MSPTLRPLRLPLLVEERRKRESESDENYAYAFYTHDAASSETASSPVTSTFSSIRGHARGSSSASSFDFITPASSEGPSSPAQPTHKVSKNVLADVQEEPLELEDSDEEEEEEDFDDASSDQFDLYDCLRNAPCIRQDSELVQHAPNHFSSSEEDVDYDVDCLSDPDFRTGLKASDTKRGSGDSSFTNFSYRFGTRFSSLGRWKSARQASLPNSPVSEFSLERNPRGSARSFSGRSSSMSAASRYLPDRSNEPPLPPTPALSLYESNNNSREFTCEDDGESAMEIRNSIQKQRAMATTPLLPPMMGDSSPNTLSTAQPSPLESPSVETFNSEPQSPLLRSPPLSAKPSLTSFPLAGSSELPPIPKQDEWSEKLGHANFTILPEPYKPEAVDYDALRQLRADWDTARVNFTKHLARTGENYGDTSRPYAMTEAKWIAIESIWSQSYDELAKALGGSATIPPRTSFEESPFTTLPRMGTEGKFPERGDEDIVGPMVRQPTMTSTHDANFGKRPSLWRRFTGPLRK